MADLFRVADDPTPPDLPGRVTLRPTLDELIDALAAEVFLAANECVRTFGDYHLVLPPGRVGTTLCTRLMVDPLYRALPWRRTHVWLAREFAHPPEDQRSAFRQIADLIEYHAGIPGGNLHSVPRSAGDRTGDRAGRYQDALRETLAWREPGQDRLDTIILDASFGPPETRGGAFVLPTDEGGVALSREIVTTARSLAVFALGASAGVVDPAEAYRDWTLGDNPEQLPGGELRWYLDHAAIGHSSGGTP